MARSKSFRRHQEKRIKDKTQRIVRHNNASCKSSYIYHDRWKVLFQNFLKLANHLANCSCFMCGNPRNHKFSKKDKLTKQELKQIEKEKVPE